jgi:hypothetical protein
MIISIKFGKQVKNFTDKQTVFIGKDNADFIIPELGEDEIIKLVFLPKYKTYAALNLQKSETLSLNNSFFSKTLLNKNSVINSTNLSSGISISVLNVEKSSQKSEDFVQEEEMEIEEQRISIVKDIGYKCIELKSSIKTSKFIVFLLNISMFILGIVSSFGITNFLFGFGIDNSTTGLNLTTNVALLLGVSAILIIICNILTYAVFSLLEFNKKKKLGVSNVTQKFIAGFTGIILFVAYVINLFYYSAIPSFKSASFFISLLFTGGLAAVSVANGYFKFQVSTYSQMLNDCEYRQDFESVINEYRDFIKEKVNSLSQNRINSVKNTLLNNQLKMVVETFIGILTAPFLAYGVSNTLASCFPEAANWVRISGLRFSPIFLVLATFLIIFAFFSFVRAFTIAKQIKGSEIIRYDGFHDYNTHGVTIYGIDSIKSLENEKSIVMFIACFIILIEFTMNVSYFITEIGGDIQGIFLSFVTALVPTALLIAETHMLSATMQKINNYSDLLATLD